MAGPKLTEQQIVAVREACAAGAKYPDIAAEYGVTRANVSQIARGEIWKEVGGPRTELGRPRGHRSGGAALTDAEVLEIRAEYEAGGVSMARLAARHGVTEPAVRAVIAGTRWRHVGGPTARPGQVRGERHPLARLTDALVRSLRTEYAAGNVSLAQLARRHGLGKTTVRHAIRGEQWRHVS